jgi:GNAT superfamily N-acetyltransferase
MSVRENILSDPSLVTANDCVEFLFERGKGWVCEIENNVVGFSIVDMQENNVWALFLHPVFEKRGIGRKLHEIMLDWYFNQTDKTIWLGTSPGTRAESFYRKSGWAQNGMHGPKELKFEMTFFSWNALKV